MMNYNQLTILILMAVFVGLFVETYGERCRNGDRCRRCCGDECCDGNDHEDDDDYGSYYAWNVWNMWYFWFIVIFVLMSCFGGCGYWRRRHLIMQQRSCGVSSLHIQPGHPQYYQRGYGASPYFAAHDNGAAAMDDGIPATMYASPPAYTEVISKPDVYPAPIGNAALPPYPGPIPQSYQATGAPPIQSPPAYGSVPDTQPQHTPGQPHTQQTPGQPQTQHTPGQPQVQ